MRFFKALPALVAGLIAACAPLGSPSLEPPGARAIVPVRADRL